MSQFKKLSALFVLTVAGLFAGVACTGESGDDSQVSEAAQEQNTTNHCQNKCAQTFNKCTAQAKNPGGLNMCRRQNEACLATCQ
jgi:hypothetical protein